MIERLTLLTRLGRRHVWKHPSLYRPFGILRDRGDCFATDFDVWIDGYPRSANTFAVKAFELANPGARIRSHRHIPPFIVTAVNAGKPGIFVIRKPVDAAASYAIYLRDDVGKCLDYYIEYHKTLRPYASQLFVAHFEMVTRHFSKVITRFNERFGTDYSAVADSPETEAQCFTLIDGKTVDEREEYMRRQTELPDEEFRMSRPSAKRNRFKPDILRQIQSSPALQRQVEVADRLYREFMGNSKFDTSLLRAGEARRHLSAAS